MKVLDFMLGFFGTLLLGWASLASGKAEFIIPAFMAVFIGMIVAFAKERKFIAIGILSTLAIPLIGVGACFMALSNFN